MTLEPIRFDLALHLCTLARLSDLCVAQGAGARLLNIRGEIDPRSLAVEAYEVGAALPAAFRYAIEGQADWAPEQTLERTTLTGLAALVEQVSTPRAAALYRKMRLSWDISEETARGLADLVRAGLARHAFDSMEPMTIGHIAVLADMNERSVRNALSLPGEAGLVARRSADGELLIEPSEARRWLAGRRGFEPTVWPKGRVQAASSGVEGPLDAPRLLALIRTRLAGSGGGRGEDARARLGWANEKWVAVLATGADALSPDDCPQLSEVLEVDTRWLTEQVLRIKFPAAMSTLGVSAPVVSTGFAAAPFDEAAQTLEVELTDAGIRNGYFDMDMRWARKLFPADSFGDRGAGARGFSVTFHHPDGESFETDVRVKSPSVASLRKRFGSYFSAHQARPGDRVRIKRLGERSYRIEFLAR